MKTLSGFVIAGLLFTLTTPAQAQPEPLTTWNGLDGSISISFPPGWRRLDEMMRKRFPGSVDADVLIEMDKGDAIMGEPGVNCRMKIRYGVIPPGQTAASANKAMANPQIPIPEEPGVVRRRKVENGVSSLQTEVLPGGADDMMIWTTVFAQNKKLYMPSIICSPNQPRTGITPAQVKDVRAMFDAVKVTLK